MSCVPLFLPVPLFRPKVGGRREADDAGSLFVVALFRVRRLRGGRTNQQDRQASHFQQSQVHQAIVPKLKNENSDSKQFYRPPSRIVA